MDGLCSSAEERMWGGGCAENCVGGNRSEDPVRDGGVVIRVSEGSSIYRGSDYPEFALSLFPSVTPYKYGHNNPITLTTVSFQIPPIHYSSNSFAAYGLINENALNNGNGDNADFRELK
jgi:hypothetical protein